MSFQRNIRKSITFLATFTSTKKSTGLNIQSLEDHLPKHFAIASLDDWVFDSLADLLNVIDLLNFFAIGFSAYQLDQLLL